MVKFKVCRPVGGNAVVMSGRQRAIIAIALAAVLCLAAGGAWFWNRSAAEAARRAAEKTSADTDAARRAEALRARAGDRDCALCPEVLSVMPGLFDMGSPDDEHGRFDRESPRQRVSIARPFRMGKYEVTVGEFAAFVEATGYRLPRDPQAPDRLADPWRRPGFEQTGRHPVVNVTWQDATAYVAWLRQVTGKDYRLPSEAEWEYAARAGTTAARFWSGDIQAACRYANVGDFSFADGLKLSRRGNFPCADGHVRTAPAGSFEANPWGFHDLLGNAQEWTQDCWNASHAGIPADGTARTSGDCYQRPVRGGSWLDGPPVVRAAMRVPQRIGYTDHHVGFRVVRGE